MLYKSINHNIVGLTGQARDFVFVKSLCVLDLKKQIQKFRHMHFSLTLNIIYFILITIHYC